MADFESLYVYLERQVDRADDYFLDTTVVWRWLWLRDGRIFWRAGDYFGIRGSAPVAVVLDPRK
jgi:hypothetical protein